MSSLIALADCDNFYVSCERIFRPNLRDRPVIVLSNNDGCVIARSQEIKDMGVKIGTPYYQMKDLILSRNIAVFSSNYELYGDISSRVMNVLMQFSPDMEIYSIDEAFLEIDSDNPEDACRRIIDTCRRWLSIPVKVGISHTKTLSKVAAELVKKQKIPSRYKVLTDQIEIDSVLKSFPVQDIWGIGPGIARKLNKTGVKTASELISLGDDSIRGKFNINLRRTVMELRGIRCFDIETNPEPKKNMCFSRSFGEYVTSYDELSESVVVYATEAAVNLRIDKLKAQSVSVFIMTNRFNEKLPQYANIASLSLPVAANDTFTIVHYAKEGLKRIYRDGFKYKKSGILLNDLLPESYNQPDLFAEENPKFMKLSEIMDEINSKYGRDSIVVASSGLNGQRWKMSRRLMSKKYTTRWDELPDI